jgi:CheY-like chemotaxis protein
VIMLSPQGYPSLLHRTLAYVRKPVEEAVLASVLQRLPASVTRRLALAVDEPELRRTVRRVAEQEQWETRDAAADTGAFETVAELAGDAIIVDREATISAGPQLLRRLYANELTSRVPVVVLTAAEPSSGDRLFDSGFVEIALSPTAPIDAYAAVAALVGQYLDPRIEQAVGQGVERGVERALVRHGADDSGRGTQGRSIADG